MAYTDVIQADSPALYWRLDDSSGPTAVATVGPNGTYEGTSITFGVAGLISGDPDTAVQFADTNPSDIFTQSVTVNLGGTNPYSFELWIKPTALTSTTARRVVSMGIGTQDSFVLEVFPNGTVRTYRRNAAGLDLLDASNLVTIPGTYYIVVTYDGTNLRTYVNGGLVAGPLASSRSLLTVGTINLDVGEAWDGSTQDQRFSGVVDEFAYYSSALTSTQVANHYAAGAPLPEGFYKTKTIGQAVKRGAVFCLGEKWARPRRGGLWRPALERRHVFA